MKLTIRNTSAKLVSLYDIAQKRDDIKKPLSWALYQTWRWAEKHEVAKDTEVWNAKDRQIVAPKGTFKKIYEDGRREEANI